MKEKLKVKSRIERLHEDSCNCKVCKVKAYQKYAMSTEVVNGKLFKKETIVMINPSEEMKKYKVTDFCLENLIECGAVANLKTVSLTGDVFTSIDNALGVLSTLENIKITEDK